MVPQDLSSNRAVAARVPESWDPYDVWLKRVKLPRDRQPGRAMVVAVRSEPVATGHGSDDRAEAASLLLPGVP